MGVEYCEYCHKYIDLDYNSEHFMEDENGEYICEWKYNDEQEDR